MRPEDQESHDVDLESTRPHGPAPVSIEELVDELWSRRANGEQLSDDEFVAQHPDRADELAQAIRKRRIVTAAQDRAREHPRADGSRDVCLKVSCPHCHAQVETQHEAELTSIVCSTCGGSFSLVDHELPTRENTALKSVGHFDLIETVGVGAFGTVWKAHDRQLDRTVAVKIPRRTDLDPHEQELFYREARAVAQLKHPGIVPVHEVGRENDSLYIVTDLIRGVPLSEWIKTRRLSPQSAARLCVKIAEALHAAHESGVIHRDLKPANILIEYDEQEELIPHITDFGLARRAKGEVTMTLEGRVLGTPAYMSPEQAKGDAHRADARSDVYSLGVILFELLTGELPFRGEAQMLIYQVIHDDPMSLRRLDARIPRDLETICLKCLEKSLEKRYPSARDLRDDLRRYMDRRPIHARPISRVTRLNKWVRRKPALAALVFCLNLIVFAGIPTLTLLYIKAEHNRVEADLARQQSDRRATELAESQRIALQNEARTKEQLNQATETVTTLITTVDESLRGIPGTGSARSRILRLAVRRIDEITSKISQTGSLDHNMIDALLEIAALTSSDTESRQFAASLMESGQDETYLETKLRILNRASESLTKLQTENPDDDSLVRKQARIRLSRFDTLESLGRTDEARPDLEVAFRIRKDAIEREPTNLQASMEFFIVVSRLARLHRLDGNDSKAADLLNELLSLLDKAPPFAFSNYGVSTDGARSWALCELSRLAVKAGKVDRALQLCGEAIVLAKHDANHSQQHVGPMQNLAAAYIQRGRVHLNASNGHKKALYDFKEAGRTIEQALKFEERNPQLFNDCGQAHYLVSSAYLKLDDKTNAVRHLRMSLKWYWETAVNDQSNKSFMNTVYSVCYKLMTHGLKIDDRDVLTSASLTASRVVRLIKHRALEDNKIAELQALTLQGLTKSEESGQTWPVAVHLTTVLERLVKNEPEVPFWRSLMENVYSTRGRAAWKQDLVDDAARSFSRAVELFDSPAYPTANLADRASRTAHAKYMLVWILGWQAKLEMAEQAVQDRMEFLEKTSANPPTGVTAAQIAYWQSQQKYLERFLERVREAIQPMDYIRQQTKEKQLGLLTTRCDIHRYRKESDKIEIAAEVLRSLDSRNPKTLYNVACCYGLSAQVASFSVDGSRESRLSEIDRITDLAMTNLRAAVRAGFTDIKHMSSDKDLTVIREQPSFKRWFETLPASLRPAPPPLPEPLLRDAKKDQNSARITASTFAIRVAG